MLNKKGVSLIALIVTIIVMIIIAGIVLMSGIQNVDETQRTAFMTDLETLTRNLETYNTRAVLKNNLETEYYEDNLNWDGKAERTTGSAKMENKDLEDTPTYILGETINDNLVKGKIKIIKGRIYVKKDYLSEYDWATEYYSFMLSGDSE